VTPTLQAEPDCARPADARAERPLIAERRAFHEVDRAVWNDLAALNACATPFSSWAFHRAWWDAYGENAHDETLVVIDPSAADPDRPVAIVPLMDRHVVEPSDAATHTFMRHQDGPPLTPVAPTACAVYLGATYHADYATILAGPADLAGAAEALVTAFANDKVLPPPTIADPNHPEPWSAVDLRRLRQADPATDALATAFGRREIAEGWTLNVEREDVCPVIRIPVGTTDIDGLLATLGKKERHEIRRKVRRAEAAGPIELVESTDPVADLDAFIDLHQARWGERGLFPPTPGGDQSRRFIRRLFELFAVAPAPAGWSVHLGFLTVAGRRIAAEIHFETPDSVLYYNAGVDPEARELSPGVVLLERLVRRAIERGKCRVDLLRGDEPYKYEWGAVDEPIQRILVRRTGTLA
jgi:CelD/BcsL family acetyltransferase involved in cellulose biosynthesis